MQANAISYESMLAYSQLKNIRLSQWDIEAICLLDGITLTDPIKLKKGTNDN